MISLIFKGCITALATAIILGVTVIVLAVIVYFVTSAIRGLMRLNKNATELNRLEDKGNGHN